MSESSEYITIGVVVWEVFQLGTKLNLMKIEVSRRYVFKIMKWIPHVPIGMFPKYIQFELCY